MSLRILAGILSLAFSSRVLAQADTSGRPISRPAARSRMLDSSATRDTEDIVVVRSLRADDAMSSAERRRMQDTLATQRRRWDQRRPSGYIIRVLRIDDCLEVRTRPRVAGELLRARLVVHDTSIVRRELAPIPAAYEQRCALDWRVDDLFADVQRALSDSSADITGVVYDPAYGFPRAYWIARGYARGGGVLVESFAPAP